MRSQRRHTYWIIWSDEDQEYVGLCTQFPSLSHLAPTVQQAADGIVTLVDCVVREMAQDTPAGPDSVAVPAGSPGMTNPLTQHDIAALITASVEASLRMALAQGLPADQAGAVAKAIGGNAAMVVYLEIQERGVVKEDA